ncbi:hypothetical protein NBRC116494_08380 [Aurantivibrio plasticivorans]
MRFPFTKTRPPTIITLCFCSAVLLLCGCSSKVVKTANPEPVITEAGEVREDLLLDVGVEIFGTGIDDAPEDEDYLLFAEVRKAESRYMPVQVMESLQISAAWGPVRVVPPQEGNVDVYVEGDILQSDGEILALLIRVSDATGRIWFSKIYEGLASKYAYESRARDRGDPFQNIYNRIANDMREYQMTLSDEDKLTIRRVSELRFAQAFSPDAFSGHLEQNKAGHYELVRLPAENDPMLMRIHQIRERDYLFIDTLQDYYGGFVRNMQQPYQEWRKQTYHEVTSMRKLQQESRRRTIAGVLSVLGGIAAVGSNNGSLSAAGYTGILGGGYLVKSGFDINSQSKIHIEALQELGDSLEAEIEPKVIELEDQTITLSGTVENQYDQWRQLLKNIYQLDTGAAVN